MFASARRKLKLYGSAFTLGHKPKNIINRNKRFGFLHIGKNAGSTVGDFFLDLADKGAKPPVVLGHDWTMELAAHRYPGMKLSFLLRDPLERTISGFNSRLRQGRPRNQNQWQVEEAAAFAHFRRVEDFLDACLSDDEYLVSAARFAQHSIQHVKDGYAHHFGSVEALRKHRHRILCVGMSDDVNSFLLNLLNEIGIDPTLSSASLESKHKAAKKSSMYLESYSETDLKCLREFFRKEYLIFDELRTLVPT